MEFEVFITTKGNMCYRTIEEAEDEDALIKLIKEKYFRRAITQFKNISAYPCSDGPGTVIMESENIDSIEFKKTR